jgi:hypothetical protein
MTAAPRKQSKTYKVPKRPFEAARLDAELKVSSDDGAQAGDRTGWEQCESVKWHEINEDEVLARRRQGGRGGLST